MALGSYDEEAIKNLVTHYRNTFSSIPTNTEIYTSEDAMMWDGYIEPVEILNKMFSDLFRYSEHKEPTDIKLAQEPDGVAQLNIGQIAYFVTDILAHEKTHQGLFATMLKNGVIDQIIGRLEILLA